MKKIIRTLGLTLVVAVALTSCSKDDPAPTSTTTGTVDPITGNTVYTLDWTSLDNTSWKYVSATVPIAINWDGDPISNTDLFKEKANNCKWDDIITFVTYAGGVVNINDSAISCNNTVTWKFSLTGAGTTTGGLCIFERNKAQNSYACYGLNKMYKTPEGKTYLSMTTEDPTGKQQMTVLWEKL